MVRPSLQVNDCIKFNVHFNEFAIDLTLKRAVTLLGELHVKERTVISKKDAWSLPDDGRALSQNTYKNWSRR